MKNRKGKKQKIVVLLTDFGSADPYVGVMKGVVQNEAPGASVLDLTHGIPAHNIRLAAYSLMAAYRYFPEGALFLCVVDPGVGSDRKIIFAEAGDWKFLAPDNGLLSWVFRESPPRLLVDVSSSIKHAAHLSKTFHGRDLFSPLAAIILNGKSPRSLGPVMKKFLSLPFPEVQKVGSRWEGEILAIDGFGNLITNISSKDLEDMKDSSRLWFEWGTPKCVVRNLAGSYSSVEKGKLLAIAGSAGFVELSVREGNASHKTNSQVGDKITLHIRL